MSEQWSGQEPSTWEGSSDTSSTADAAKAEAGNVAQTSKESAASVAGTAKEQGQQVLSEATNQAKNLLDETKSQVTSQAGEQQQRAATGLRSVGEDLRSMASTSFSSGVATQLVQHASEQVNQVAGWLENRQPGDLLEDVRNFARRKPGTFLIGAAVAGMLAGRATRAGVDIKRDQPSGTDSYPSSNGYSTGMSTMPPVTPAQPEYPYDTPGVGTTGSPYASGDTYAAGTYAGDTYSSGTYASGSAADTTWTDPSEPQR